MTLKQNNFLQNNEKQKKLSPLPLSELSESSEEV